MINFKIYNYIKNIRRLFDIVNTKKYLKFYNKNKLPISNKSKFFKYSFYRKTKKIPNRLIKNSNKYVFNSKEKIKNINKIFFLKKPVKGVSFFKSNLITINSCFIVDFTVDGVFLDYFNINVTAHNTNLLNNLITLRI